MYEGRDRGWDGLCILVVLLVVAGFVALDSCGA